ncbi:hypothetical protein [Aureibacter tunicatorum]|uniref:Lipoprotein n=1 Tax=Aureibacter tunicatorum TaxID=866807 RepID=A0AAE4BT23_9BACT|nr:hypothetical protein [Aureibacter tunicatorum]MDR6239515.1 hypothetical protein [Aureibacter tunicatorum]BDD03992.1 hypothetical protein AUTU_14750 [Aureibacter tunicatorum]
MHKTTKLLFIFLASIIGLIACESNEEESMTVDDQNHDIAIVTNINSSNPATGYIGTIKDLTVGSYEVSNAQQSTVTPFLVLDGDDVYMIPNQRGDRLIKYRRNNGKLDEIGSLSLPTGSISMSLAIESKDRAFLSLRTLGKIAVINPTTMEITDYIDLTSYAIDDASPDPTNLILRNDKLYVACQQSSDGFSSVHPAQILIIDLNQNNSITSTTDSRTTFAGALDDTRAMFFDEKGDLYIFCMASYGFVPEQKCGFLRIKEGAMAFDPEYFFNVSDYAIDDIPGNKLDYFQHILYHNDGTLFGAGNIYSLASNPPDYVNDRTVGSFKVDIYNQSIAKLDLPYCNGYSASLAKYNDQILWGLSTETGVGIYTYDLKSGKTSDKPIVTTQGDPSVIEIFN